MPGHGLGKFCHISTWAWPRQSIIELEFIRIESQKNTTVTDLSKLTSPRASDNTANLLVTQRPLFAKPLRPPMHSLIPMSLLPNIPIYKSAVFCQSQLPIEKSHRIVFQPSFFNEYCYGIRPTFHFMTIQKLSQVNWIRFVTQSALRSIRISGARCWDNLLYATTLGQSSKLPYIGLPSTQELIDNNLYAICSSAQLLVRFLQKHPFSL